MNLLLPPTTSILFLLLRRTCHILAHTILGWSPFLTCTPRTWHGGPSNLCRRSIPMFLRCTFWRKATPATRRVFVSMHGWNLQSKWNIPTHWTGGVLAQFFSTTRKEYLRNGHGNHLRPRPQLHHQCKCLPVRTKSTVEGRRRTGQECRRGEKLIKGKHKTLKL